MADTKILRIHFDKFDTDKNGNIDSSEIKDLFKDLGWEHEPYDIEKALSILDADKSGTIEWDEFKKWSDFAWQYKVLQRQGFNSKRRSNKPLIKQCLSKLSEASFETIEPSNITDDLKNMNISERPTLPQTHVLRKAFEKYDKDGNGSIDTGEMKSLLTDLGWIHSEDMVGKAMEILDEDKSGTIEWEEFSMWSKFACTYRDILKEELPQEKL